MDEEDEHSPSEFYYTKDLETFDVETETGITECHIIKHFLSEVPRTLLENIGPRSWQYGLRFARSVLPRTRAKKSPVQPFG